MLKGGLSYGILRRRFSENIRRFIQWKNCSNTFRRGTILESRALTFGSDRALHFSLNGIPAVMPYEECADGVREGKVRDIALLTRVGRSVCFVVTGFRQQTDGTTLGDPVPCRGPAALSGRISVPFEPR